MSLRFSFIIVSAPGNDERVNSIIRSIESQEIPEYEILIVGSGYSPGKNVTVLNFDETVRPAWITKKKNYGARMARFENLVIIHDYIAFEPGWYDGFLKWNKTDWKLLITPLITLDGRRWRDFTIFPPHIMHLCPQFSERALLPYDFVATQRTARYMYISGAYFIVKREVLLAFPLDESRCWGQGEDVEWCERLARAGIVIRCNPFSVARIVKPTGDPPNWQVEISKEQLTLLKSLDMEVLSTEGCDWIKREKIPALLPDVPVHLVVDSPDAQRKEGSVNVFISIEPPAIWPRVHQLLRDPDWCSKWDIIACADPSAVALKDKARKYVHTPFWVEPPEDPSPSKILGISTIMSSKTWTEGHRLRHWLRENWPSSVHGTIFYGAEPAEPTALRQPYPEDRRDCFRYMFHLVIENCRSPGYFTEKLMDCLRCRAVPIYWGDPKIGEVFDTSGMILVGDLSGPDVVALMRGLTEQDYRSRLWTLIKNAETAERMAEGDNAHPRDPSNNPGMYNRLAELLREAQKIR